MRISNSDVSSDLPTPPSCQEQHHRKRSHKYCVLLIFLCLATDEGEKHEMGNTLKAVIAKEEEKQADASPGDEDLDSKSRADEGGDGDVEQRALKE